MSLYANPETHAANPPETWTVVKASERSWNLVDKQGTILEYACKTKRDAEALKTSGFHFDMYNKETRWYAGESLPNWKSWATVQEERARNEAWQAARKAQRESIKRTEVSE